MSVKRTYAVFGLGRYGRTVAEDLAANGEEVLAVDLDQELVNECAEKIPLCKCGDVTDPEVLGQLGIEHVDMVVISMGKHLEESIMATVLCKELGVPTVIVKCASEFHCKILEKVGADRTIFPEKEAGARLAKNLMLTGFVNIVDFSKDVSIFELPMKEQWIGKSLAELNLRRKLGINVIAIIENGAVIASIEPEKKLKKNQTLIVIAKEGVLKKLK